MHGLRISDVTERGSLAFDLRDLLEVLGERVAQSDWWCFVGECVPRESHRPNLEEAFNSSALLEGRELLALASETLQVKDGEFEGFREGENEPWITLKAIDSTFWDVFTRDAEDLTRFEQRFQEIEHINAARGRGNERERLLRLRRPSDREIAAVLGSGGPLSYSEVGETAHLDSLGVQEALASRYDVDRHQFDLGKGRDLFERAHSSLMTWRHFDIPWLEFHGASQVTADQVVATVVRVAGVWFLNLCRVVYTELPSDGNSAAYAYGTVRGHAECGEERFRVSFDPVTEEVTYEIAAFSRPAIALSKLGYPLARRLQKRFAASSAQSLARAVARPQSPS